MQLVSHNSLLSGVKSLSRLKNLRFEKTTLQPWKSLQRRYATLTFFSRKRRLAEHLPASAWRYKISMMILKVTRVSLIYTIATNQQSSSLGRITWETLLTNMVTIWSLYVFSCQLPEVGWNSWRDANVQDKNWCNASNPHFFLCRQKSRKTVPTADTRSLCVKGNEHHRRWLHLCVLWYLLSANLIFFFSHLAAKVVYFLSTARRKLRKSRLCEHQFNLEWNLDW